MEESAPFYSFKLHHNFHAPVLNGDLLWSKNTVNSNVYIISKHNKNH